MNSCKKYAAVLPFFLLTSIFEFQEKVYADDIEVDEEGIVTTTQELSAHKKCNDGQTSRIERASVVANSSIVAGLREVRLKSPIYKTWFGDWEHSNPRGVRVRLRLAKAGWNGYEFRCSGHDLCAEGYYGVAQHYALILSDRLYVCHKWHGFPPLSIEVNSRVETLIHEVTHSGGTVDVKDRSSCGVDSSGETNTCYGAKNARRLALDPTCQTESATCKASMNAANYGYFVSDALVNYMLVAIGL